MNLYLRSNLPLKEVAARVAEQALPGFQRELREGLNVGGGDYYKFSRDKSEIILVCNDAQHAEVFDQSRADFPYYCYVWQGPDGMLEQMFHSLSNSGFACELFDPA